MIVSTLIDLFCTGLDEKLELTSSCFDIISDDPSKLLGDIEKYLKEFEVEDNITAMVL